MAIHLVPGFPLLRVIRPGFLPMPEKPSCTRSRSLSHWQTGTEKEPRSCRRSPTAATSFVLVTRPASPGVVPAGPTCMDPKADDWRRTSILLHSSAMGVIRHVQGIRYGLSALNLAVDPLGSQMLYDRGSQNLTSNMLRRDPRADMPTYEYNFPALRGIQAGREYYVSMCPLRLIPRIFLFDEDELRPELRAQRILNKARVPEIAFRYHSSANKKDYTFGRCNYRLDRRPRHLRVSAWAPTRPCQERRTAADSDESSVRHQRRAASPRPASRVASGAKSRHWRRDDQRSCSSSTWGSNGASRCSPTSIAMPFARRGR